MGTQSFFGKYKSEMIVVIVLALVLVILGFTLNMVFKFTPTEAFLLDLHISLVGLIISVMLILRKTIELSFGPLNNMLEQINKIEEIVSEIPPPIPHNLLSPLKRLLAMEKEKYEETYDIISRGEQYTVQKEEMYQKLTNFANVMSAKDSDEILAVSSVDIFDFQTNLHAAIYLEKNGECFRKGVSVKRIFLLSTDDLKNKAVVTILRTHGEKLSEVRWIDKKILNPEERKQDFAIFNNCILVDQRVIPAYIISNSKQIESFKNIFDKIWNNSNCRSWEELNWGKGEI